MSLIAGSYDHIIWGYKLKSPKDLQNLDLNPLFSFPSHLSTIKCADVSGSVAVSGGSDDTIKIYDLSTRSEIGSLHESATINSLTFYTPPSLSSPHSLISAADDGSVSLYYTDPFVHLKTVKVHQKGVNSLSIHPAGGSALTVGQDKCLAMVDLERWRRIFYHRLDKEASIVKFNETGETFYMVMDEKVSVYEPEDARLVSEFKNAKRILCAASGEGSILFTGGEDRNITIWDTKSGKVAHRIDDAHSARVKGIVVLSNHDGEYPNLVASASSDGNIRVWDLRMGGKVKSNPLAMTSTKSRLTCLAGSSIKYGKFCFKRKRRRSCRVM